MKGEGQRQYRCNEWELKEIAIKLSPVHLRGEGAKEKVGLEETPVKDSFKVLHKT